MSCFFSLHFGLNNDIYVGLILFLRESKREEAREREKEREAGRRTGGQIDKEVCTALNCFDTLPFYLLLFSV